MPKTTFFFKSHPFSLKTCFFSLCAVLFAINGLSVAQEDADSNLTGFEIAKSSNERYVAHDESTELWMLLINSRGEIRTRKVLRLRKSFPDHKRVVLKFIYPEDIRDTGFLNEEKPNEKYDTQFLYLPVVKKVRRISAANKEQRWVGSDFFYEDIQEVKLNDWTYQRLADGQIEGFPCYAVEWSPKTDAETVYGKEVYWYRKEGFFPVRIDYFSKKGGLWKRVIASDIRYNQGVWMAWKIVMEDFDAGHITKLLRRWIFFDTGLPDDYFTTRTIEKNVHSYSHPSGLRGIINEPSEYDKEIVSQ